MNESAKQEILSNLQGLPISLLMQIKTIAKEIGINNIALVGGAVRDRILVNEGIKSFIRPNDIDIVVQGSASRLAYEIQRKLGDSIVSQVQIHTEYNTAEIKINDYKIDLASARVETYNNPGENPKISLTTLEKDLSRRDFSINSMAIDLTEGILIDPHNGKDALLKQELDFIHSNSVSEDPTRIVRGARYAARLNFKLTKSSLEQIKYTLINWPWAWRSGDPIELAPPALTTRLRLELELLFANEPWEIALKNLQDWGGLAILDEALQADKKWGQRIRWAKRLGLNPLTALIAGSKDSIAIATRLKVPKSQHKIISESVILQDLLSSLNISQANSEWPPSRWVNELETRKSFLPEAVALTISLGVPTWKPLLRWWGRWRMVESPISAKDLIKQGRVPGPDLGNELKELRLKYLDEQKK